MREKVTWHVNIDVAHPCVWKWKACARLSNWGPICQFTFFVFVFTSKSHHTTTQSYHSGFSSFYHCEKEKNQNLNILDCSPSHYLHYRWPMTMMQRQTMVLHLRPLFEHDISLCLFPKNLTINSCSIDVVVLSSLICLNWILWLY